MPTAAARPPVYTPATANRALPLIRAIAQDAHETYLRVRERLAAFNDFQSLEELSSDLRLPESVREGLVELNSYVRELGLLGARFGEPERGIVYLDGRIGRRRVELCWKIGEESVRHWIPLNGDYADRRPIRRPGTTRDRQSVPDPR